MRIKETRKAGAASPSPKPEPKQAETPNVARFTASQLAGFEKELRGMVHDSKKKGERERVFVTYNFANVMLHVIRQAKRAARADR